MVPVVISGLFLLGLPLFLLFFFKAQAGVMFLAACAGLVLLSSLDPGVVTTAGALVPQEGEAYIRLAVVMLSIIFSAMVFRHSLKGSQLGLHLIIVFILGVMLWLILPGATGVSWLLESVKQPVWKDINEFRTLVIAAGFSLSLLSILIKGSSHAKKSKH